MLKDAGQAETSPQEVLKVLGFLYSMTVHPYGYRIGIGVLKTVRIASFLIQPGEFDLVRDNEGSKLSSAIFS